MIKNIIFDLDGTLIDSSKNIIKSIKKTMKDNSLSSEIPISESMIGPPLKEIFFSLLGNDDPEIINKLIRDFINDYDNVSIYETLPFEGVNEVLKTLYLNKLNLYIATNKRYIPTIKIIQKLNWNHFFKKIYTIDKVHGIFENKTEMLKLIIYENNLNPNETVYIGDRNEDGEYSESLGINFLFAMWGYGNPKSKEWNSIDNINNLYTILRNYPA